MCVHFLSFIYLFSHFHAKNCILLSDRFFNFDSSFLKVFAFSNFSKNNKRKTLKIFEHFVSLFNMIS